MTSDERRVANRLKRGVRVVARWVPQKNNPRRVENRTLVRSEAVGGFVMTGWPNGDVGDYERHFESAERAAEAFVGTVGSELARRALASQRRMRR